MSERKESRRAAQEEFRRALTGEFEPVKASPEHAPRTDMPEPSSFRANAEAAASMSGEASALSGASEDAAGERRVPASDAKRAVAARAERLRAQKKRRHRIVFIVVATLVALAIAIALAFTFLGSAANNPLEGFFDESAQSGQAPNKTPAELQAELNRIVEEGMFNISIASVIEFAGPNASGKAYIENVPNNPYDMTVDITLKETGESVYASKGIAPGNYIEDIQLTAALESGSHDAVATFTAYDRETHAEKGKAAAEVTLLIGKGGDASG